MTTYSFSLTLSGITEIPVEVTDAQFNTRIAEVMDEICGRILAVGCDDSFLSARGQTYLLGFDREAESLADAVGSAIRDVEKAGYKVARIEVEEPATVG